MKAYKNNDNTTRIAVLETLIARIDQTLSRIENRMDKLDEKLEINFNQTRQEMNEIKKENTSQFRITIFTLLTLIGTPLLMESMKLLNKFMHGS